MQNENHHSQSVTQVTQNDLQLLYAVKQLFRYQDPKTFMVELKDMLNICMRSELCNDPDTRDVFVSLEEYLSSFFKAIVGLDPRSLRNS